jgi:hypothetical protein
MKNLAMALRWVVLLALSISYQAKADLIVDTGVPNSLGFPPTLSSGQWLAAKFITNQDWHIASLEGFLNAGTGTVANSTFTVVVYGDSAHLPDTGNELFAQQASFANDGWNGVHGLDLALSAGSYWLAFEVRGPDSFEGVLPVYVANPLATAWNDPSSNDGYNPASGTAFNFGVRISSVPVPASVWLFVSGLFAVARLNKRQTA